MQPDATNEWDLRSISGAVAASRIEAALRHVFIPQIFMNPEPSESMLRALRDEKASFRSAVTWALVSLVAGGGGTWMGQWKTQMLTAAGQWPDRYGEALVYPVAGTLIALIGLVGMLGCFIRWLRAIRLRRRLAAAECSISSAFQQ